MGDIAQIGFAADTSGLDKAKTSLNALVPAAAAVETASENVTKALNTVSNAGEKVSNAAKGTTTQTAATAKVLATANGVVNASTSGLKDLKNANDNATDSNKKHAASHTALSTQAMAAQHSIRSMVEQMAMGMPISTILSAQLNHLSYAASGPGGITKAFGDAAGVFAKLITPTVALVGALALVSGAVIYGYSTWKTFTLGLMDTASIAQTTTKDIMALQAAASVKGINGADFNAGIQGFAKSVYEAKSNMGGLSDVFTANNLKAQSFDDYLSKAANLIKNAAGDQQRIVLLQQMGLPATMEWVRLLSGGAEGLDKAKKAAAAFATSDELLLSAKKFDESWNRAWTNFGLNARSAFQRALDFGSTFFDKMENLARKAGNASIWDSLLPSDHAQRAKDMGLTPMSDFSQRFAGSTPNPAQNNSGLAEGLNNRVTALNNKNTIDPNVLKNNLALQQQSISVLGDLATVEQQVTLKQNELNLARLNHVNISKRDYDAIITATRATAEQNDVNAKAAAGIFNLSQAQSAATNTLQHWIDKGLVNKNNSEQMAAAQLVLARNIKATSDAAAIAAAPLQGLKQLELDASNFGKQLDGAITGSLNNLVQPIQDTLNGVNSLSDGFKNGAVIILKAIQEMIIKMLILAPIAKGLQSIFSGFTGGVSDLFSFATSKSANGNVFNSGIQPFAKGGTFTNAIIGERTLFSYANGKAFGEMGEAGPEAVMPLKRGPNGSLGVQMYGQNNNDNAPTNLNFAPQYNIGGNVTQEDLANVKKAQERDRREFMGRVAAAIPELRKRGMTR